MRNTPFPTYTPLNAYDAAELEQLRRHYAAMPTPTPDTIRETPLGMSHYTAWHDALAERGARLLEKSMTSTLLASEKREADKISVALQAIDEAPEVQRYRREIEYAASRVRNGLDRFMSGTPAARTATVGADLRTAIAEVRDGRSVAYVELEGRALAESGSGGYGVNTVVASSVQSLGAKSVVMSLPGVIKVNANTGDRMRFPRFGVVTVGGVAEAASLTAAATDLDAVDIVFQKFATYEILSTELEEDFAESALTALGDRMLADVARRVDLGLLQGTGAADCVGLFNQAGVSTTSVAALPADFDKVAEAIYQLEANDGTPGAWIMHPRTWRILKQIKTGISSDKTTLLSPDPQAAPKTLDGLPVFTTSQISITSGATSAGSIAAVVDPSQIVIVTRRAPRLEVSRDVNFSTDQIAIRCTTRVGLGVIDAAGGISLLTDIRAS